MIRAALLAVGALALAGCNPVNNMRVQPRVDPYQASDLFDDGTSARPPVEGTVTREPDPDDEVAALFTSPARDAALAVEPDLPLLEHGREQFEVYCSPCHGRDGYGEGMIVRRGFPRPPSYHDPQVRARSDRHYFRVVTEGIGQMPPYGSLVPVRDRVAIILYVRALQLSQAVPPEALPPEAAEHLALPPTGGTVP